jgi:hypothetical protein
MALEDIRFRTECRVPWESMKGGDTVRHCGECGRNVYDLSSLGREQAERLVGLREFTDCVTLFRRPDGTVVTRDCAAQGPRAPAVRTTGMLKVDLGPVAKPDLCPLCGSPVVACRSCRGRGYRWVPGSGGQAADCPDCGGRKQRCGCRP